MPKGSNASSASLSKKQNQSQADKAPASPEKPKPKEEMAMKSAFQKAKEAAQKRDAEIAAVQVVPKKQGMKNSASGVSSK